MKIEKVRRIYDFYSDFYDIFFSWILGPQLRYAMRLVDFKDGQKILEVGIGTGISLKNYPAGCYITGIDISSGMLKKAEERARRLKLKKIELKVMDATKIEFPDKYFDYVLAAFVLSVCPHPKLVLNEMLRVLKDDGLIVLVNHFASENKLLSFIEKMLNPVTKNIGWRMDLSLSSLINRDGVVVDKKTKLFPGAPWSVVILRKALENERFDGKFKKNFI